MAKGLTVALDGMGGDAGPAMVLEGAALAVVRHPSLRFLIFGDQAQIEPLLAARPQLAAASELRHCDVAISMDDKPSQALRRGRKVSSMWRAIEAVKTGEAQVAVSAGNTGALMAMAKVILKTLPHIERPAIAALWPTTRGESIVLDLGATIGPDAEQLLQFSIMGDAYARVLFDGLQPTIGLLNIGQEEVKGTEAVKTAAQLLRLPELGLNFYGFVEGDDLGKGTVDVVVTDGFTGNIALKAAEGTARQITDYLRAAIERSMVAKIGAFLAQGAFRALREKLDPRASNGGVFLGLNGLVVKSHGGTDGVGFASAIDVAVDVSAADLVSKIGDRLAKLEQLPALSDLVDEPAEPAEVEVVES